ncbi:MAG: hypothetical protein R3F56_24665 [Planctomycetota bacterium]
MVARWAERGSLGFPSQVAMTALNTASLLGIQRSLQTALPFAAGRERVAARDATGAPALPIEVRRRLLYNPDLVSSHFLVPGLVGIILQLVTLFAACTLAILAIASLRFRKQMG